MKNERQCGLAIPDIPCRNEHRLLALLAGDAVHRELGDVVTAVGVHFRELGRAGDGRSEALGTGLASFTSSTDHLECFLSADYDHSPLPKSAPKTLPWLHIILITRTPNCRGTHIGPSVVFLKHLNATKTIFPYGTINLD